MWERSDEHGWTVAQFDHRPKEGNVVTLEMFDMQYMANETRRHMIERTKDARGAFEAPSTE